VILQVLAYSGQVMRDGNAQGAQLISRTYAGQQHQARRVDRAAAQDQLTIDSDCGRLVFDDVLQAHGAAVLYQDLPS
jgi:hypothetical protein